MKRYLPVLLSVLFVLGILTGCGGAKGASSADRAPMEALSDQYYVNTESESKSDSLTTNTGLDSMVSQDRKLIRTVHLFAETDQYDQLLPGLNQKLTELGADCVVPVKMERCVVKLDGKDAAKKTERWQKIAREAVKQCARVDVPEVCEVKKLTALREELKGLDLLIVPWEDARDGSIRECVLPLMESESARIGILIGPEGGISEKEARWLNEEASGKLVTLGPRILRTETAGLCALTMVMAYMGELE